MKFFMNRGVIKKETTWSLNYWKFFFFFFFWEILRKKLVSIKMFSKGISYSLEEIYLIILFCALH